MAVLVFYKIKNLNSLTLSSKMDLYICSLCLYTNKVKASVRKESAYLFIWREPPLISLVKGRGLEPPKAPFQHAPVSCAYRISKLDILYANINLMLLTNYN